MLFFLKVLFVTPASHQRSLHRVQTAWGFGFFLTWQTLIEVLMPPTSANGKKVNLYGCNVYWSTFNIAKLVGFHKSL